MLDWLRNFGVPPLLVVTKCDKVSKNEREKQLGIIAKTLGVQKAELTPFSALSRDGQEQIWQRIEALLEVEDYQAEPPANTP